MLLKVSKPYLFYGWVIVAIALVNIIIAYAVRYSYSVFFVAILDEFRWGRAATMGAFAVSLIAYAVGAPFVGVMVDRYGIRKVVPFGAAALAITLAACSLVNSVWQMVLAFGLTAVGTLSLGYVPHLTIVANWFTTRRGLAMGVATAGLPLSMLLVPGLQYLISAFGWRTSYLLLAGLTILVPIPLAAIFLKERPSEEDLQAASADTRPANIPGKATAKRKLVIVDQQWVSQDWTLARAARTFRLWALAFLGVTYGIWSYSVMMHQVAYLVDAGYSRLFAAAIVGLFGIAATAGAVGAFVSDWWGREKTYTLSALGSGLGLVFFYLASGDRGPAFPYIYGVVFGFSFGLASPLMAAIAADLFQGKHLGAVNGLIMGSFVLGGALGAWLTGQIYDVNGSYYPVFPLLYALILLSVLFAWWSAPRKVRRVGSDHPCLRTY